MRPYGIQVQVIALALCASPLIHAQTASLSPTSMSFSNQAVLTTSASKSVKVTNTSSTSLVINSITPSNPSAPFTVTNNCTAPLALNAFCTITATFSPTATGSASETVTISDNSTTGSPQVINVSGTGVAQASVSPTSLSFGSVAVGANKTMTVTLTNNLPTALSISNTAATGDYTVNNTVTGACGASITAGGHCSIGVTFTPSVLGTRTGTLTITDLANTVTQAVSLTGTAITPATVSPTSLSFGNVALGFNKTMTVTLTNNLATAMSFNGATATGDYAVNNTVSGACGASIAAGGHCSVGVTFTPSLLGTRAGTLTINDAASNSPQFVSITGSGVAQATVSPASLSFGNVGLGTNSTTSVTLTNNLSTTISVGIPQATGDFAVNSSVSGSCGATLAAGAHCSIGVTLTPTQLGTRTGMLTITESAGNGPLSVPLTGTGTTSSILSVTITPPSPIVLLNSTLQLTATANFPGAISLNVTTSATWSSSSTTFATITSQGLVSGIKQGTSTIKATYAGKSVSATLTVAVPVKPIIVWPTPAPITYGTSLSSTQLNAVAKDIVTGAVVPGTYMYYPLAGDTPGVTTGLNLSVQFFPTDTTHYLTTNASVVLVVNRATVNIIFSKMTVPYNGSPQSPTITTNLGDMPYTLTFTDGSNNTTGNWPIYPGTVTANVLIAWTNYQGTGNAPFTITKASPVFTNLASQTILSGAPSVNVSGNITAGAAIPIAQQVSISINGGPATNATIGANGAFSASLNTSALTSSNSPYAVTYSYAGDANFNPVSDSTTSLNVKQPTLVSIALTPQNRTIALNGTQQFTAMGNYSDNTTQDLTGTATWTFAGNSAPSANAVTSVVAGLATAATTGCGGPVTITATSGTVSASTTLMMGVPGGFACGANTTAARDPHTATLLNNGLILIAGGFASDGSVLGSAELYDPVANTSTATGALQVPRARHTATLLNNGKVLFVGGVDSSGNPLNSVEIYDPILGSFTLLDPADFLVNARMNHTATLLNDGTVAVIGGTGTGPADLASIEVFDPSQGAFSTPTGGLTNARNSHTGTLLSTGDVLVAGGYSGTSATNSAEVVTISLGAVTTTSVSMTTAHVLHTATALNNRLVLIAGGMDGSDVPTSAAETYDPIAQSFTSAAPMACNRAGHSATALTNGTVLLAGGCSDGSTTAEIFDPSTAAFSSTAPAQLNTPRTLHTATLVHCACPEDGWVLLADGVDSSSNVLNTTEWYQPATLTPAGLNTIQVSPATPTVALGASLQLTATGTFTSVSPQVLNGVSWTSSDPTVFTVTNDGTNSGVIVPVSAGTANLTACAGTVCSSATPVTVNP